MSVRKSKANRIVLVRGEVGFFPNFGDLYLEDHNFDSMLPALNCFSEVELPETTLKKNNSSSFWLSTHPSQIFFDHCFLFLSAARCHQHVINVIVHAFNILHVLISEIT